MEQNDLDKIDELLQLPKYLRLSEFEHIVARYLERKADKRLAIQELDHTIGLLQSHVLSLSMYVKQCLLLKNGASAGIRDAEFFTLQEVAVKYRVSVRTVRNWIVYGLESVDVGGVVRISSTALETFISTKRRKKFGWKSVVR